MPLLQGAAVGAPCSRAQHAAAPRLVSRLPAGCGSSRPRRAHTRLAPAAAGRTGAFRVSNALGGGSSALRSGLAHSSSSSSSSCGRAAALGSSSSWSPLRQGRRPAGPHIAASLAVRGRRIVITASLAGVADSPTDAASSSSSTALLASAVKGNQELITGKLANGLRYVLLPNPTPPQRFEAHLEVHAGSVDERPHEQGVAHLVEHVTFLGSKRRESLLGTGARANAYTDFHHTVFHVHAPLINSMTGRPMLPQVLEALAEIAFQPQFLPSRIEKERKAVLAEAQMMNTIEYRIDCQLLTYLHAENNLGCRFPIGKTEQVKTWPYDTVQAFWRQWYFPANVTLYIVGDFGGASNDDVTRLIDQFFGKFAPGRLEDHGGEAAAAALGTSSNGSSNGSNGGSSSNGHAANGNGSSSSGEANGSSSASASSSSGPPVRLLPALPAADAVAPGSSTIGGGSSWADYVIPNGDESTVLGEGVLAVGPGGQKLRHPVRPPVQHRHGCGPMGASEPAAAPVSIFRHPLLQQFMLTVFCKLPVVSLKSHADLKYSFIVRILLSTFQFRVNQRYVRADPPFISIGLDISDSGREGCAVSTLTITSQPAHWKGTVKVAVEEMRRLQRYGVTAGELERYVLATMRDSAQLAEQANSVPSINSLDFVMESLALGHTVMSHREAHEAMEAVAATITLEDVNAVAASLLTFASDVGREAEVLQLAAQPDQAGKWAAPGPTRATSVVACIPAYVDDDGGARTVGGAHLDQVNRGAMGASGHLDADAIDLEQLEAAKRQEEAALREMAAPEGAQEFTVSAEEILAALASPEIETEPLPDVELPEHLVDPAELEAAMQTLAPRYVPLEGPMGDAAADDSVSRLPADPDTGITQRRLSNGVRVNYTQTDNEPKAGLLRVVAAGGRASEPTTAGPGGIGSVGVGTRTLSEGGAVGRWSREEVEAFCIANLIHSVMDSNDEFLVLDIHFAATNGGLQRAFELLHEVLAHPRWEAGAFERSKLAYVNAGASVGKSLERATSAKIINAMLGPDPRFKDPEPEALDALTLEGVAAVIEAQLHPSNLELTVAGDFDADELEELVLRYMGTLQPRGRAPPSSEALMGDPIVFQDPPLAERHITWHLHDSDERAAAYIAGPAPCRWGPFDSRAPLPPLVRPVSPPPAPATNPAAAQATALARRGHPLYATITLQLLAEVVNSRLFTTVRDSLGLTYDVSFEITTYDRLRAGWFSVLVTSYPDKIHEALAASLAVLRDIGDSPITPRELMRAKRTLLTRHESDLKDNNYWLGLLTHLQSAEVPHKRLECLRDLRLMYESATIDDLYDAYQHFDFSDTGVFTAVGTSGKAPPPPPDREKLDAMFGRGAAAVSGWGAAPVPPGGAQRQQQQAGGQQAPAGAGGVDWAAAFSRAFAAAVQTGGAPPAQPGQQQPQQAGGAQPQAQQAAAAAGQPGQQQQQKAPDPMAMLTALLAATQGKQLAQAMQNQQQQGQAAPPAEQQQAAANSGGDKPPPQQ